MSSDEDHAESAPAVTIPRRNGPMVLFIGLRVSPERRSARQSLFSATLNRRMGELEAPENPSSDEPHDDSNGLLWLPLFVSSFSGMMDGHGSLNDNDDGFDSLLTRLFHEFRPRGPPPASESAISSCPITKVTSAHVREGHSCAVCQELFVVADEKMELPCLHSYHPECIKPWLKEHNTCPTCRYELAVDDTKEESERQQRMALRPIPNPELNTHIEDADEPQSSDTDEFTSHSFPSATSNYLDDDWHSMDESFEEHPDEATHHDQAHHSHGGHYDSWDAHQAGSYEDDYTPGTYEEYMHDNYEEEDCYECDEDGYSPMDF